MTMLDKTCDVCGENESVGVCGSALGAFSFAICSECLFKPAEHPMMFENLYIAARGDIDGLDPSVKNFFTVRDGEYTSFEDWWKWRKTQPDPELPT